MADRNIVFLYYHDMGPLIPSTAPFSFVTRSRYWMAGLVASGVVMVIYCCVNTAIRLLNKSYAPPPWQSVWLRTAVPLTVSIPLITMTTPNAPGLPINLALWVTSATLAGVALAIQPGTLAGHNPFDAALLAVDGLAISLINIGATGIERIQGWLARGAQHYVVLMAVMILSGGVMILVMTGVRYALKRPPISAMTLFIAGLCVAYPGMSILHHVMFTDGYFYITDSDNFFSRNIPLQVGIWITVWLLCMGISRLQVCLTSYKKGGFLHNE